jgi:hypothetical protein
MLNLESESNSAEITTANRTMFYSFVVICKRAKFCPAYYMQQ